GGMDKPSAGSVHVENIDLSQLDADQISDFRARKIGFVFQFFNLIPELTAAENVDLPMRIAGLAAKERERRTAQLLGQVGLSDRAAHRPGEVSGGEQQRVAIAVALANDPPVILADEPTGELDTESGAKVLGLLRELAKMQAKTVVVATHDMRIVRYADRVLRIVDGRILREEELESAAGQMKMYESEELERLRKRVAELSDTLARIRESFTSAER
ncbi:ABC transporter ATP-binding protein, partial [bacterium]